PWPRRTNREGAAEIPACSAARRECSQLAPPALAERVHYSSRAAPLIAVGVETQALHVWDLAALRRGLAELGLGGDALPHRPGPERAAAPAPLTVTVDLGDLLRKGK